MEFNHFPPAYEAIVLQSKKDDLQREANELNSKLQQVDADFQEKLKVMEASFPTPPEESTYKMYGAIGGVLVLVVFCLVMTITEGFDFGSALGFIPGALLYAAIGAYLVSPIFFRAASKKYDSQRPIIATKRTSAVAECNSKKIALRQESKKKCEEIENLSQHKCKTYEKEFESAATEMSIKFAESSLATEIIVLMSHSFIDYVNLAKRGSHITKIVVPFEFRVYNDQIRWNTQIYDFKEKRCQNLTSPLEQTALARAIGSAVQLNLAMKYPKDPSGTAVRIDTHYAYKTNCVVATITYSAANGMYKDVRSWTN